MGLSKRSAVFGCLLAVMAFLPPPVIAQEPADPFRHGVAIVGDPKDHSTTDLLSRVNPALTLRPAQGHPDQSRGVNERKRVEG